MFKKRHVVSIVMIVAVLLLSVIGCTSQKQDEKKTSDTTNNQTTEQDGAVQELVFGSGSLGSFGYTSLEAMSNTLNKFGKNLKASAVSTSGGTENIVLLFNKQMDMGHATSADFTKAWKGEKPFKEKLEPVQLISYGLVSQLVAVKADSKINSLKDLEGKSVAIGPNGSSQATLVKDIFDTAKIKIKPTYLSMEEGKDAFISGLVDAIILPFINNKPYPIGMQAEAASKLKYLDWDHEANEKMVSKDPSYLINVIAKGATPFIDRDIESIFLSFTLACRSDMPEAVAYNVTKTLLENSGELLKISPNLTMVNKENVTKGLIKSIPVHKGAVKYFKEIGIWNNQYTESK